jgi:hypothetical protein
VGDDDRLRHVLKGKVHSDAPAVAVAGRAEGRRALRFERGDNLLRERERD